jgi:hypothetical protein
MLTTCATYKHRAVNNEREVEREVERERERRYERIWPFVSTEIISPIKSQHFHLSKQ